MVIPPLTGTGTVLNVGIREKSLGTLRFPPVNIQGNRHFLNSYSGGSQIANGLAGTPEIHANVFNTHSQVTTFLAQATPTPPAVDPKLLTQSGTIATINGKVRTISDSNTTDDFVVASVTVGTSTAADTATNAMSLKIETLLLANVGELRNNRAKFDTTLTQTDWENAIDADTNLTFPLSVLTSLEINGVTYNLATKYIRLSNQDNTKYVVVKNFDQTEYDSIQGVYLAQIDQYVCSLLNASLITDFTPDASKVKNYPTKTEWDKLSTKQKRHTGYQTANTAATHGAGHPKEYTPMHYTQQLRLPSLMDVLQGYVDENGYRHPAHCVHKLAYAVREIENDFLNRGNYIHEMDEPTYKGTFMNRLTFSELNKYGSNGIEIVTVNDGENITTIDPTSGSRVDFQGKIPIVATHDPQKTPSTVVNAHAMVTAGKITSIVMNSYGDGYHGIDYLPTNLALDYNAAVWNNTVNRAATEPTRFEDRPRLMSKIRKISDDNNMWTKWLKSSSLTTDGIYLPLIDYTTPYSTVNIAGTIRHVFEIQVQLDDDNGDIVTTRYFTVRKASDLGSCVEEMMFQFHKYFSSVHTNVEYFDDTLTNGYNDARDQDSSLNSDFAVSVEGTTSDGKPLSATDMALSRAFAKNLGAIAGQIVTPNGTVESNHKIRIVQIQKLNANIIDHANDRYDPDDVYPVVDGLSTTTQSENEYVLCGVSIQTENGELSVLTDTVRVHKIVDDISHIPSNFIFDGTYELNQSQVPLFYIMEYPDAVEGSATRSIKIRKLNDFTGEYDEPATRPDPLPDGWTAPAGTDENPTHTFEFQINVEQYSKHFPGIEDSTNGLQQDLTSKKDALNRLKSTVHATTNSVISDRPPNDDDDEINVQTKIKNLFPSLVDKPDFLTPTETINIDSVNNTEGDANRYKELTLATWPTSNFTVGNEITINDVSETLITTHTITTVDSQNLQIVVDPPVSSNIGNGDKISKKLSTKLFNNDDTNVQNYDALYDASIDVANRLFNYDGTFDLEAVKASHPESVQRFQLEVFDSLRYENGGTEEIKNLIDQAKYNINQNASTAASELQTQYNEFGAASSDSQEELLNNLLRMNKSNPLANDNTVERSIDEFLDIYLTNLKKLTILSQTLHQRISTYNEARNKYVNNWNITTATFIQGVNKGYDLFTEIEDANTIHLVVWLHNNTDGYKSIHGDTAAADLDHFLTNGIVPNPATGESVNATVRDHVNKGVIQDGELNFGTNPASWLVVRYYGPSNHADFGNEYKHFNNTAEEAIVRAHAKQYIDTLNSVDIRDFKDPADMFPAYQDNSLTDTAVGNPTNLSGAVGGPAEGDTIHLPIVNSLASGKTTQYSGSSNLFDFLLYSFDDNNGNYVSRLNLADTNSTQPNAQDLFGTNLIEKSTEDTLHVNLLTNASLTQSTYKLPADSFETLISLDQIPDPGTYTEKAATKPARPTFITEDVIFDDTLDELSSGVANVSEQQLNAVFATTATGGTGFSADASSEPATPLRTITGSIEFDAIYLTVFASGTIDSAAASGAAHFKNLNDLHETMDLFVKDTTSEPISRFYFDTSTHKFIQVTDTSADIPSSVKPNLLLFKITPSAGEKYDASSNISFTLKSKLNDLVENGASVDVNLWVHAKQNGPLSTVSEVSAYLYSIHRERIPSAKYADAVLVNSPHKYLSSTESWTNKAAGGN